MLWVLRCSTISYQNIHMLYNTLWFIIKREGILFRTLLPENRKTNIEDDWNEVGQLMVLTTQIHTYCLGSLRAFV